MLVALAVALPFLLLSAGIIWQLAEHERDTRREAIMFSTRALLLAVDTQIAKQIAVAELLATSPALLSDDLVEFRREAERARPSLSGGWVVLSDETGQQLVNLIRPPDAILPRRNPVAIELQRRAFETRTTLISNVLTGAALPVPIVAVEVPVIRPNKPPLGLSVIIEASAYQSLLDERRLPEGWLGGLLDRNGHFVARSRDHDRQVGRPASEGFRASVRRAKEGWFEFSSLDGGPITNFHVTSDLTGWVMALAAEHDMFEAPVRRTVLAAVLAAIGAMFLSLLLAIWAARNISKPIEQIEEGAHALRRREPVTFDKTGVPEVDRALDAFTATASVLEEHEKERDEREAHVRLIMRELSHRSKNLLAIVLAIARQTARQSTNFDDFSARFNARVQALADAHDLLVEQQWVGAPLEELVRSQLSAFGMERVAIGGEPIMLRAEAVQNIGLALHELATNASKYGSLSVPDGKIAIDWTLNGDGADNRTLRLTWRETDGPPVAEPTRRGFGRFVLERATVSALGKGTLEFPPSGLVWTCEIDGTHLVDRTASAIVQDSGGRVADRIERRRA